jgi:hypothetical protein
LSSIGSRRRMRHRRVCAGRLHAHEQKSQRSVILSAMRRAAHGSEAIAAPGGAFFRPRALNARHPDSTNRGHTPGETGWDDCSRNSPEEECDHDSDY